MTPVGTHGIAILQCNPSPYPARTSEAKPTSRLSWPRSPTGSRQSCAPVRSAYSDRAANGIVEINADQLRIADQAPKPSKSDFPGTPQEPACVAPTLPAHPFDEGQYLFLPQRAKEADEFSSHALFQAAPFCLLKNCKRNLRNCGARTS
jgi:hypothetical protein